MNIIIAYKVKNNVISKINTIHELEGTETMESIKLNAINVIKSP